jgi:intracellular multiplication protein IcmT
VSDTHWRNSMKPARFFFLDARAAVPFVFALLHLRWYTLVIAAVTTLIFYILEARGLNFVAALRAFRVWLVTKKRPNVKHSDRTRLIDYGFEPHFERPAGAAAGTTASRAASAGGKGASTKPAKPNQATNQSGQRKAGKTVRPATSPAKKN